MSKGMKVVHVLRRFSPEKWGGTEHVVLSTSKELLRRKIEISVFCTDMLSEKNFQTLENIPVRRFRYVFPWFFLSAEAKRRLELKGGSPLSLPLFFALLREKDISIIHTHVQHRLGGMARTAARIRRIPYVVSLHGGCYTLPAEQAEKMREPFRGKPEWGKIFGALLGSRRVLRDAAAVICVGRDEAAEVKKHFPGKPVHYLPNGVDVERFSNADGGLFRRKFGFAPEEKLVLCVSRIDYQKNQLGLVRAFAQFAGGHPGRRLVLVGPVTVEAYRSELAGLIRRLGLEQRVTVIEGLDPLDPLLPAAYAAAEMFVLASVHEPFGMVILEAWAAGLPAAAYAVGGIPGFAEHEKTALLASPGDEAALAGCMARLADDAPLRCALAQRAFAEAAAQYGWSKNVDELLQIYEKAVANP